MAIFGIGAHYDGQDVSDDFVANKVACIGWSEADAPAVYEVMKHFKVGDIVYIKSAPIGHGIRVKAIGIVDDNKMRSVAGLGEGVGIKWVWSGHENLGTIDDKYNVRNNTIYEEYSRAVQNEILKLLFSRISK